MDNAQAELAKLESTDPETVKAILAVHKAYDALWDVIDRHPTDREYVASMLGLLHAASVIPRMVDLEL
jgi:uncharacterized protein (DUF362 family)